jgi:hypothetical protein
LVAADKGGPSVLVEGAGRARIPQIEGERLQAGIDDRAVRGRLITVDQTKTLGSKVLKNSPSRPWVHRAL